MSNKILDGIMGLCAADALGVPVEFSSRESLQCNPVTNMRGYGTYNLPPGTWSDDTSMTLCLVDSLNNGLDYKDIMEKFLFWANEAKYTPYDEVFDIGSATMKALMKFAHGEEPLKCGGESEYDNGNGSLMRILPVAFYLQANYGTEIYDKDEAVTIIHNVSSLTHAHKRSLIACGIYISIASMILGSYDLMTAVQLGVYRAVEYYKKNNEFAHELTHYERIYGRETFANTPLEFIKSSGYVVDTLEAAIWCLLNTNSYKDCVLMAVNLGQDTDTVAAVAGGLAGLYYGYDSIPGEWLSVIAKREYIADLCNQLYKALTDTSVKKLTSYIPYFKSAKKESVCYWNAGEKIGEKTYTMTYPVYEDKLNEFIQAFYNTNLICYNYMDIINEHGLCSTQEIAAAIDTAEFGLLKAILTGFVRQERFCDGLWVSAIEDKVFLKILQRLQQFNNS